MRHGKGTYWVCIGKNKFRKLYTGDWFENNKEGQGIYFYKDGSCYEGSWKNSKRDGKGLMVYSNGDIYEGQWAEDLKHGYGILEQKNGNKYYGYWNKGLKEGQGYYYYSETGKIYLGEWHEDAPRCGIFTDVDDDLLKKEYKKHFKAEDPPAMLPKIKLVDSEVILENSINNVNFIRNIKLVKSKNLTELFGPEFQSDLIQMFSNKHYQLGEDEDENILNKSPDNHISIEEFQNICFEKLHQEIDSKSFLFNILVETLEIIFRVFDLNYSNDYQIDFLLFARLFYLVYIKNDENLQSFNESNVYSMANQTNQSYSMKEKEMEDTNENVKEFDEEEEEY